jgi:hypothetical protein
LVRQLFDARFIGRKTRKKEVKNINIKIIMRLLLLFLFIIHCLSLNISSWWVGNTDNPIFPIEKLNFDAYTHIVHGGALFNKKGIARCNKTDNNFKKFVDLAHKKGVKIMWGGGGIPLDFFLWDNKKKYMRDNYLKTIGKAVRDCNVDGISIDYEFSTIAKEQIGIVTPKQSTIYSHWLKDLKKAIGKDKLVSADISIEGIGKGNWILGVLPWINVTMLNRGDFDYINTMSYHWSSCGSILAWEKDMFFIDLWGIDRKRVNLGLPYFSTKFWQHSGAEPTWNSLSPKCPNIDPLKNTCNGTVFVGKQMNYELGQFIKKNGFRGAFPWAANYDSIQYNNSLIKWLSFGMKNSIM